MVPNVGKDHWQTLTGTLLRKGGVVEGCETFLKIQIWCFLVIKYNILYSLYFVIYNPIY